MKTKNLFLTVLGIAAVCIASCKKPELEENATLILDQEEVVIETNEAGTVFVLLTTNASKVEASYTATWLTVTATTRGITIKYEENTDEDLREAIIKVKAGKTKKDLWVRQAGAEPIPTEFTVGMAVERKKGIIYWVDPNDNTIAKAVSTKRLEAGEWGPATKNESYSYVNGKANSDKIGKTTADRANYYCSQMGEGWYLPSYYELLDIFNASNGIAWDDENFVVADTDKLKPEENAARQKFDGYFALVSGAVRLNTNEDVTKGDSYFSSTEVKGKEANAYYVRFGRFDRGDGKKTSGTARYVRCVKVFGNYTYPHEPIIVSGEKAVNIGGTADAFTTVTYAVQNASLISAEADADCSAWCSANVAEGTNGFDVTFTATANNNTEDVRTGNVVLTAKNEFDETITYNVAVTQAICVSEDKSFSVKDLYKENNVVVGIVFWVDPTNPSRAKIVSVTRSEAVSWASEGAYTTSISTSKNNDDGAANTAAISQYTTDNNLAEFPPITFVKSLGDGWYLPAINELEALFLAYNNKTVLEGEGGCTKENIELITGTEKTAREAFDNLLKNNGGVAMNGDATSGQGDGYWSSTQSTSKIAWGFRFGKYYKSNEWVKGGDGSTPRYVRGVKVVTKE